ncbi:hypothetical protein MBLNU457_6800t1 [Dothideomycetes sp. NU457]
MSTSISMRPFAGLKAAMRQIRAEKQVARRCYATAQESITTRPESVLAAQPDVPEAVSDKTTTFQKPGRIRNFHPGNIYRHHREQEFFPSDRPIPTATPPPSAKSICKDPIAAFTQSQLSVLDPNGLRTRLFSKENPERANVGDILLVRMKNGDPFAGVCLNVRQAGIDTGILLRNQLTRVGVEMWFKIYSPNVEGIEVVQRKEKRARRARLYYMRQPRHDVGSVENIVRQYQKTRAALRSSDTKGRDTNARKKKNNKRGSN